jgi:broad specificity phosphatase PhoE
MLIVVRHGRTAHNASRRLLGRLDLPLDELGGRQAAAIGRSELFASVERVVSSPLQRARATAEAFGRPVEIDDRWIEIDYGIHDGLPLVDVPSTMWAAWAEDPDWAPEGGESLGAVGRRVRAACDDLWADAASRDVVVVTHVSPIRSAVKWGLGLADATEARFVVDTASVSRIGPGGRGGRALHSFNEIHHRPSE